MRHIRLVKEYKFLLLSTISPGLTDACSGCYLERCDLPIFCYCFSDPDRSQIDQVWIKLIPKGDTNWG